MVFEKVKHILAEYKDIDESEIEMDTTFDSMEIDSLDTVELVMNLEEEFDIEIELDDDVTTVGDLVKTIERLV